jgi:hypothetical protein
MPLETRAGVASGDATLPPADSSPHQRAQAAPRRCALALVVLGGALFLWRLGSHDLLPPDEPRFALVAREMAASGDYSVLSLNHRLYTDKPPLFFWAINGFALLSGGVNEWAARLPSALSGLLALLLVLRLGTWLYEAHLDPGTSFGATEEKREAWGFYTGRFAEELDSRESLLDFMSRPGPRCLLLEEENLRDIRSALPSDVAEVLRGKVSGQEFYLLSRPARP